MMNSFEELVALFQQAAAAHHQAYQASDGVDPEWPLWYADFLREKLAAALGANFTKSELVYLLVRVSNEQVLDAPGAEWAGYYADFFISRYQTGFSPRSGVNAQDSRT
jgi:hypothetical protein